MTAAAPLERPAAPQQSAAIAIAGVLFGLGVVLGVVAIAYLVFSLSGYPGSSVVCMNSDSTMGECLLASRAAQAHTQEAWALGLSLMAGGVTSIVAGALSLLLLRRR